MRQFRVALGRQPRFGKEVQGDDRTPVGRYYIADKNADSRFHRFLGLSYPNIDDAERGYQRGLIGAEQWADIFFANLRGDAPPSGTALGGRVGIHGFGGRPYCRSTGPRAASPSATTRSSTSTSACRWARR